MHGIGLDTNIHSVDILSFFAPPDFRSCLYGVVPKGLLALPGSLYKEVAKTTSGTLVYRFGRLTARKKNLPSKNTVSST